MSDWTKEQRARAATHLCEEAARLLRTSGIHGRALDVIEHARTLALPYNVDPQTDYRDGLDAAGIDRGAADACVNEISAGYFAPSSPLTRIFNYRREVQKKAANPDSPLVEFYRGQRNAIVHVLDIIIGKPK